MTEERMSLRGLLEKSADADVLREMIGLAKAWECLTRKARAFLHLSSIRLIVRKLCKTSK